MKKTLEIEVIDILTEINYGTNAAELVRKEAEKAEFNSTV